MEKEIGVTKAREQFGELVEQVQYKGDSIIINRNGKPAAAIVPIDIYQNWKKERKNFFNQIRKMQANAGLKPDEADKLAREAVSEIRNKSKSAS
ncbi:MAG TPA: type II toxin-antitoxin system Phd/YefM family antitoxin [Longilinea sp.]|nr:type II toxin-antitoxin system Phd/YefM family antitoxin [Longilinea sp.]